MPRNREKTFELRNLVYLNERSINFLEELYQSPASSLKAIQNIDADWWTATLANMQLYFLNSPENIVFFPREYIERQRQIFNDFKELSYQIFLIEKRSAELPEIRHGNKLLTSFLHPNNI